LEKTVSSFDPKKMQQIEEKADSLLDKLKNMPYTALFLIGAGLMLLGLLAI